MNWTINVWPSSILRARAWHNLFLCATELHCCTKFIITFNILTRCTVALADKLSTINTEHFSLMGVYPRAVNTHWHTNIHFTPKLAHISFKAWKPANGRWLTSFSFPVDKFDFLSFFCLLHSMPRQCQKKGAGAVKRSIEVRDVSWTCVIKSITYLLHLPTPTAFEMTNSYKSYWDENPSFPPWQLFLIKLSFYSIYRENGRKLALRPGRHDFITNDRSWSR